MNAFAAMRVSTTWRHEASQIYAPRAARVPAQPDALLQRIAQAQAGDTLLIEPGTHLLSEVALIDKPLKLRPVSLPSKSLTTPDSQPVIVSTSHMLMRARCNIVIEGLTLIRMGAGVGYPNAVVSIEGGKATLQYQEKQSPEKAIARMRSLRHTPLAGVCMHTFLDRLAHGLVPLSWPAFSLKAPAESS